MKLSTWALEHLRFALMVMLFVGVPTVFGFPGNVVLLWLEGLINMAMGPFQWVGLTHRFDGKKTGFNRFMKTGQTRTWPEANWSLSRSRGYPATGSKCSAPWPEPPPPFDLRLATLLQPAAPRHNGPAGARQWGGKSR